MIADINIMIFATMKKNLWVEEEKRSRLLPEVLFMAQTKE